MRKDITLKKALKRFTVDIDLIQNELTSILNTKFTKVAWRFDEDILFKGSIFLDDITITDENQIESFISEVEVIFTLYWNIDDEAVSDFIIDDIIYNRDNVKDRRIVQYLVDTTENLLQDNLKFRVYNIEDV